MVIYSVPMHMDCGIIQGSGVGPTLYIIMESLLCTLSRRNFLCKYADDTNLIVSDNSDIGLQDEFSYIYNCMFYFRSGFMCNKIK